MTTVQTPTGAATFIRVVPGSGAPAPSTIFLQDGISLQPDATARTNGDGGFTVRTSDLASLQSAGMVQGIASTQQAFASSIVAGSGTGLALPSVNVQPYTTTLSFSAALSFLTGTLTTVAPPGLSAPAGVPLAAFVDWPNTAPLTTATSNSNGGFVLNIAAAPPGTHAIYVTASGLPLASYPYTK